MDYYLCETERLGSRRALCSPGVDVSRGRLVPIPAKLLVFTQKPEPLSWEAGPGLQEVNALDRGLRWAFTRWVMLCVPGGVPGSEVPREDRGASGKVGQRQHVGHGR